MTAVDALVILVGLIAGYWAVSKLFFAVPKPRGEPGSDPTAPGGQAPPAWFETLQVAPSASEEEIRTAFKGMMSQYHPDKVASLGQELRDLANRKSQEITAAYRAGIAARGGTP